ncbi:lipopolysaccharide biosynthesis protein [Streptomyces sp. NPDC001796]|uniref:lipopolysaccharide biosynthesis protein n=1 Tax=Streptomyces sp. NPDC001796 TaxID=3364609 RepID=UPI003688AB2D
MSAGSLGGNRTATVRDAVRRCADLRSAWASATVRQAIGFACSSALLGLLGIGTSALLARALDVDSYASYTFGRQLLVFGAMFSEFGLFLPAARMLARAEPPERHRITGAVIGLFVPVAVVFGLAVFALSWIVDAIFDVHAGPALRTVSLVCLGYPLDFVCLQTAQGLGRLLGYSVASVVSRAGFLALIAALIQSGTHLTPSGVLLADALFLLTGWVALLAYFRPSFARLRETTQRMVRGARDYGFSAYVGRVLSMGTYHMDTLMLGAGSDPRSFACYMCATSLAYVIGLPATGLATALFGRLARQPRIEPSWIALVSLVSTVSAVALSMAAEPLVRLIYSDEFLMAAGLVPLLAAAQLLNAVTRPFNTFLAAHGLGPDLRAAAVTLTVSNLVLNLALIPAFQAAGAAWASLLALAVNLAVHVVRYRRAVLTGGTTVPATDDARSTAGSETTPATGQGVAR